MNAYLLCAVLINIFPLETEGTSSNQNTSQFEKFLANYTSNDGIVSIDKVEAYHKKDDQEWKEQSPKEGVNSGLFRNETFLSSVIAVVSKCMSEIEEAKKHTDSLEAAYGLIVQDHPFISSPEVVPFVQARQNAILYKRPRLDELQALLEHTDNGESCSVVLLVTNVFRIIIYHNTNGESEQLTLGEFLSIMKENPTKDSLPYLIQNAFKQYMLGMISTGPGGKITRTELERFLWTNCAMEGDLNGNFENFASEMGSTDGKVQVSEVQKKWADMNVVFAFNTLVKPQLKGDMS